MHIHILRDEADYLEALAAYEAYFDNAPEPGSEAGDRFELLGLLLAKYEEDHFPMPTGDPVEAIRFAWNAKAEPVGSFGRAGVKVTGV